jgi:hypothetical protein
MTMPLALFDLSMRAASETNANTARNLTANYSPRDTCGWPSALRAAHSCMIYRYTSRRCPTFMISTTRSSSSTV